MSAGGAAPADDRIGPTEARNWGWVLLPAALAALLLAAALEATFRLGPGWRETAVPLLLAAPFAGIAVWAWRQPPFERCALRRTPEGLEIAGRRDAVRLAWGEIMAVESRGGRGLAPAEIVLDVAPEAALDAPGVVVPVRATGARAEDVVAFLHRAAESAGYRLDAPPHDPRHVGPRRWQVARRA